MVTSLKVVSLFNIIQSIYIIYNISFTKFSFLQKMNIEENITWKLTDRFKVRTYSRCHE